MLTETVTLTDALIQDSFDHGNVAGKLGNIYCLFEVDIESLNYGNRLLFPLRLSYTLTIFNIIMTLV